MRTVVAVAYWKDDGYYPRARPQLASGDTYVRGSATMAATWRRTSSVQAEQSLATNVSPRGIEARMLEEAGVQTWSVDFESSPPIGYFDRFSAATYSLDVLRHAAGELDDHDVLVLVDPDVVWVRDPAPLVEHALRSGLVTYAIPYPPDHRDLGVTRRELTSLVETMTGRDADGLIHHVGGELVVATGEALRWFSPLCDEAWHASLDRYDRGESPLLHTEEHVFSYAFHSMGLREDNLTDSIRRVWTRPGRLRNARRQDLARLAWHVLAEKGYGLDDLFDHLVAGDGPFEPGVDDRLYRARLARCLSVRPTLGQRIRFAASHVKGRVRGYQVGAMPA